MQPYWQLLQQHATRTVGCMTQPLTAKLALSISEAAQVLGVSDDLVYQLVARGQLPNLRLGRRRVIPIAALHALIDGCIDDCRGGAGK